MSKRGFQGCLIIFWWLAWGTAQADCQGADSEEQALIEYADAYPVALSHLPNVLNEQELPQQMTLLALQIERLDQELKGFAHLVVATERIYETRCKRNPSQVLERIFKRHALALKIKESYWNTLQLFQPEQSAQRALEGMIQLQRLIEQKAASFD